MKPVKLYLKIFLSFAVILAVAELMIFGLFIITAGRIFQTRFEYYTRAKVMVAKEFIKEKIQLQPELKPTENDALKNLILFLGKNYHAKIWLTAPDGTPVVKSFQGSIPNEITNIAKPDGIPPERITAYRYFKTKSISYSVVPVIVKKNRIGNLYIVFETVEANPVKAVFAVGLAVIGLIVALLIYWVSKRMTAPINQLKDSTLRIADGDLSHRADINSRDEIGDLGRSFNYMTEKLEKMIRGGRELTTHVSHELRSPLARIRVTEELIKNGLKRGDHADLKRHLNTMALDIDELDRLIGRILALSKLDIQQTPSAEVDVNLPELLNDLLKRHQPIAERKNLHITTDFSADIAIRGDKESLRMAFSNIIDNAIKFTPENGKITVQLQTEPGEIVIRTTNSLVSLPNTDLSRVFDPFYRAENAPGTGYGLGLAITKKIFDMHGGTIAALNPENHFEIYIRFPVAAV